MDMGDDDTGDEEQDSNGDEDSEDDSGDEESSELQTSQDDLYKDLNDEQRNIQDKELKTCFISLNENITEIIERMNNIMKNDFNIKILDFAITQLLKLKDMVTYYLTNTYNTKTYQENTLFYQQCLVIMSAIQKLLPEITIEPDDNI